jgi:hypothetical protein
MGEDPIKKPTQLEENTRGRDAGRKSGGRGPEITDQGV